MDKFNTHGGYFAPQGYMRINEGGKHAENPNGGVQIGVDPQGVPNMLEENESVYDDFVFSDNIKADKKFLKENKISDKYAGKLYSEIVDAFMEEAKDRPLDAISNNGLRVILSRLASAQEAQKQYNAQKDIEKELENLSPEELAQLEQLMAAEQQGQEQVQPEQDISSLQAQEPEGQMVEPQIAMACGGAIRKFEDGTPGELVSYDGQNVYAVRDNTGVAGTLNTMGSGFMDRTIPERIEQPRLDDGPMGFVPFVGDALSVVQAGRDIGNGDYMSAAMLPVFAVAGSTIGNAATKFGKAAWPYIKKAGEAIGKGVKWTNTAMPKSKVGKVAQAVIEPGSAILGKWTPTTVGGHVGKFFSRAGIDGAIWGIEGEVAHGLYDMYHSPFSKEERNASSRKPSYDFSSLNGFAFGGEMNQYEDGTKNLLHPYVNILSAPDLYEDNIVGKNYQLGFSLPQPIQTSISKSPLKEPVVTTTQQAAVQSPSSTPFMVKGDELSDGVARKVKRGQTGRVGLTMDDGSILNPWEDRRLKDPTWYPTQNIARLSPSENPAGDASLMDPTWYGPNGNLRATPTVASTGKVATDKTNSAGASSSGTEWMRYAPAAISALKGLYDVFQKPDKYTSRRYTPTLPTARMHLTDPTYIPLDGAMMTNNILAGHGATVRGLRNSGIGPGTSAAILAADNRLSGNIGNAMSQVAQMNNQMRNSVIAQRNANAQALGSFDYQQSLAGAQILNDAAQRNMQNDLLLQRLNYGAEGEKYAAVGNELEKMAQGLAGIGTENFRMNAANSMFDYVTLPDGRTAYVPRVNQARCGGTLLRKCK